jgi:CheY-like chemotaxis protein
MSASTRHPRHGHSLKTHKGIVFVVDDDEDLLQLVQGVLEHDGYLVLSARSGDEALSRMRGVVYGPTAAVIDLMMPDMTGWELVEAMKADDKLAEIPIIICTAFGGQKLRGVDAVLDKPLSSETLLQAVRTSLKH